MLNLNQPQQYSAELGDRGEAVKKLSPVVETPHFQEKRGKRKWHSQIDKEWILQRCVEHPTSHCWEWQFTKDKWGYARTNVRPEHDKSKNKMVYIHQKSYELWHGPIPIGLFVLHKCDNPCCVNPDHLFCGTNQDNMEDCARKRRTRSGINHHNSKLSVEDVLFIRESQITQRSLALWFRVSQSIISRVKLGKSYKYVGLNLPAHCWIQTEGK